MVGGQYFGCQNTIKSILMLLFVRQYVESVTMVILTHRRLPPHKLQVSLKHFLRDYFFTTLNK